MSKRYLVLILFCGLFAEIASLSLAVPTSKQYLGTTNPLVWDDGAGGHQPQTVIYGLNSGVPTAVTVDGSGNFVVSSAGPADAPSAGNSSVTPLAGNATFTGTSDTGTGYESIVVMAFSNVAGTLYVDQSIDGANWDYTAPSAAVSAGVGYAANYHLFGSSFRVRYVNGASGQATFRLKTLKKPVSSAGTGSGGGGAVTIADAADVVLGALADTSATNSVLGQLKKLVSLLPSSLGSKAAASSLAITPSTELAGSPTANATAAMAVQGMVSDGTTLQRLFTPSNLSDNVTGNNMMAFVQWAWDGTNYDRLQVDANKNLLVSLGTKIDSTNDSITAVGAAAAGAAISGNPVLVGGSDGTNARVLRTDASGYQVVSQKSATTTSGTLQNAASATGNGSTISTDGMAAVSFTVSGTFVGTITFEGTEDGVNYSAVLALQFGTATVATTATAPGTFVAGCTGLTNVRARISAYTSGAITVSAHAAPLGAASASSAAGSVTQSGTWTVQPGNTANTTPWLVDVSKMGGVATAMNAGNASTGTQRVVLATDQATLPVTLATRLDSTNDSISIPANSSVNMNQIAGTAADANSGLKSAGTLRVVLATDQPALTNKLLVTPDSVALPANQSVNASQINGVTPLMGTGVTGTGSLRVTIATDQAQLTNKLLVTPDSVALPANQSVNISQMNGVTTTMGNGVSGTGVQRVTIASDSTGVVGLATGSNTIGTLTANQSVNAAQINGVTPLMGNGASGTGAQRVTIASDSTGQIALAAGSATIGALTANQSVNLAQVGGTNSVSGGVAGSQSIGGPTAAAASLTANPVTVGGRGTTAWPTKVTDGQVVNRLLDGYGRSVVINQAPRELWSSQTTTITSSTAETTIVTAGAASVFDDLTGLVISNSSATGTIVTLKDDAAGATVSIIYVPATSTVGFMTQGIFKQTASAKPWTITCGTSVASIYVTAQFVAAKS